jgi:SpoVK/Ycf46/Vps4 family AAA+-type ATPase
MRGDLLIRLFQAHAENNDENFLEVAQEIISEENRAKHNLLAKNLKKVLVSPHSDIFNSNSFSKRYKASLPLPRDSDKGFPLFEIKEYYFEIEDLILNDELMSRLKYLLEEVKSSEILAKYGLKPKQKILFCGPPGTGKTLSAKVISSILGYPLVYINFDSIVSSYLGETATNLRKVFDFISQGEWIVLFDEFDIIGKKRDDPYEHGEIKRVVNNFMQMMDNYEGNSLLIAATNHQYLLDSAIWRRFDDILYFDMPDEIRRTHIFNKYLRVLKRDDDLNLMQLAKQTDCFSPADIAQTCEDALRRIIIDNRQDISHEDLIWAIKHQQRKKKIMKMM